jgi:arylsulfatase A
MLAREGIQFTQFLTTSSLCTPSRGAMLTSRYPVELGLYTSFEYPYDNDARVFNPSSVGCMLDNFTTIAQYLKNSYYKYYNVYIGKHHLGSNTQKHCLPHYHGYDYYYGIPYSHEQNNEGYALFPPCPLYENDKIIEQPVNLSTLTDRYTEKILDYLDMFANTKQPFFITYASEHPHVPITINNRFSGTSKRNIYGDALNELDWSVGQIIERLKKNNLDKTTLVIFISDNPAWINCTVASGLVSVSQLECGFNYPYSGGKGGTETGSFVIPTIMWMSGYIRPNISTVLRSILDIVPTMLHMANISIPPELKGYTLIPLFDRFNYTSPYTFFPYWRDGNLYAMRYGAWVAHYITRSDFGNDAPVYHYPPLLYNVEWNPSETIIYNTSDYPDIFKIIDSEYNRTINETIKGPEQFNSQNFTVMPCCNAIPNETLFREYLQDHEYSMAVWEILGCVC